MHRNILTQPIVPPHRQNRRKQTQHSKSSSSTHVQHVARGKGSTAAAASTRTAPAPVVVAVPYSSHDSTSPQINKLARSLTFTNFSLFSGSNGGKASERRQLEEALKLAVTNTGSPSTVLVGETSLLVCSASAKYSWLSHLFSKETLNKFFVTERAGNYVVIRATGVQKFEEMPLYARIGMHLLFYGSWQIRFLGWTRLRKLLRDESIRQGKIYDSDNPDLVRTQIAAFVDTYKIDLSQLLQPDLRVYKTFNDFFSRKLRPGSRPPAAPFDHSVIVSSADCRLTVWPTWNSARRIWVKGRNFTLSKLIQSNSTLKLLGPNPSLAILRLAPQDYHRFHSPLQGTVMSVTHIPGDYYTVNPQAVNQRLDVLTANVRSVCTMRAEIATSGDAYTREATVCVVAVGALLVGSIVWAKGEGERVEKGEELGWFRYGGSTVILVMPEGVVWDMDLMKSSADGLETLVRAGEQIGRFGVV